MTPARPRALAEINTAGATEVLRLGPATGSRWIAVCVRCGARTAPAELLSIALAADDEHRRLHLIRTAEARNSSPRRRELPGGDVISAAIVCGARGRGCQKIITATCDTAGCSAHLVMTTRGQYVDAAAAGWRRRGRTVACPAHAAELVEAAAS